MESVVKKHTPESRKNCVWISLTSKWFLVACEWPIEGNMIFESTKIIPGLTWPLRGQTSLHRSSVSAGTVGSSEESESAGYGSGHLEFWNKIFCHFDSQQGRQNEIVFSWCNWQNLATFCAQILLTFKQSGKYEFHLFLVSQIVWPITVLLWMVMVDTGSWNLTVTSNQLLNVEW